MAGRSGDSLSPPLSFSFLFPIVVLLFPSAAAAAAEDDYRFLNCSHKFTCGPLKDVSYPFWGANRPEYCGLPGFELDCNLGLYPKISIMSEDYRILEVNPSVETVRVIREDYAMRDICLAQFVSTSANSSIFRYAAGVQDLIVYHNCSFPSDDAAVSSYLFVGNVSCAFNAGIEKLYFSRFPVDPGAAAGICARSFTIPVLERLAAELEAKRTLLSEVLSEGFELTWHEGGYDGDRCSGCVGSGGQCGYNKTRTEFACFCLDQAYPARCPNQDPDYTKCTRPYKCGDVDYPAIGTLSYPFWGGDNHPAFCGRSEYEIKCLDSLHPVLDIGNQGFRALGINQTSRTIRLARLDLFGDVCRPTKDDRFDNATVFLGRDSIYPTFRLSDGTGSMSIFYGCLVRRRFPTMPNNFTCNVNGSISTNFFGERNLLLESPWVSCDMRVDVPMLQSALEGLEGGAYTLKEALDEGFDSDYDVPSYQFCVECQTSGGVCGSLSNDEFACLCADGPLSLTCHQNGSKRNLILKIVVGSTAGAIAILLAAVLLLCFYGRISCQKILLFWKKKSIDQQKIEAFIKNHGPLAQKKYSYAQVKRMTFSFKHKLGEGGYGSVFKGNLPNGELVAVKVLSTTKGNGEEFINEVASISRTSHVNIVSLVGFCFEGSKRALVYEFMPKGSLEKFIYNDNTSNASRHLGWEKLNQIAIGIARGLEYLHRGCNTRILHFDIKPHNILLDEDFCPKISDFGLSKLCSRKQSMVSMMEARGTIGYIAPEVFSRNFGEVSYKSDVYSYGMMVLEMVGGRRNLNAKAEKTSEIYFPHWIYKRFELNEDLGLQGASTREEIDDVRKMVIVGLWCIQTDPSLRPCMTEVIDMFEGSLEALEIPPKPFLSSPARATPRFSRIINDSHCCAFDE